MEPITPSVPHDTHFVVIDLGFGDAGKGLVTDALARESRARLVVRFNGGPQAAHNVVTSAGTHHTFSQFGSGMLVPGTKTFLARNMVIHPPGLIAEARALEQKGVGTPLDRMFISRAARVITPYHQAWNRMEASDAASERHHATCGLGFGETVRDHLEEETNIHASDFLDPPKLAQKLRTVRDRYCERWLERDRTDISLDPIDKLILSGDWDHHVWLAQATSLGSCVVPCERLTDLSENSPVVFEGAQGVLLDECFGFAPFQTWSDCTPAEAQRLAAEFLPRFAVEKLGVLRTHMVRHGRGPLPSYEPWIDQSIREDHNVNNVWQGSLRYGHFDAVLARYALSAAQGVDALVLTHVDTWRRLNEKARAEKRSMMIATAYSPDVEASLTAWLDVAPTYRHCSPPLAALSLTGALVSEAPTLSLWELSPDRDDSDLGIVQPIEEYLRTRVAWTSAGPSAATLTGLCSI